MERNTKRGGWKERGRRRTGGCWRDWWSSTKSVERETRVDEKVEKGIEVDDTGIVALNSYVTWTNLLLEVADEIQFRTHIEEGGIGEELKYRSFA